MSIYIETPRLILRTPVMEDATVIAAAIKPVWPELQRWMSWAQEGTDTIESIRSNYIARAEENNFLLGLCKVTGRFALSTGLTPKKTQGQYEVGYWVAKDFLGRGLAEEASNAAIRYGFDVLAARNIYACYFEENNISRHIIEKLGFTKTGIRDMPHVRFNDGKRVEVHEYIMTDPSVLPALDVRW